DFDVANARNHRAAVCACAAGDRQERKKSHSDTQIQHGLARPILPGSLAMLPVIRERIAHQKLDRIEPESFRAGCQLVRPAGSVLPGRQRNLPFVIDLEDHPRHPTPPFCSTPSVHLQSALQLGRPPRRTGPIAAAEATPWGQSAVTLLCAVLRAGVERFSGVGHHHIARGNCSHPPDNAPWDSLMPHFAVLLNHPNSTPLIAAWSTWWIGSADLAASASGAVECTTIAGFEMG